MKVKVIAGVVKDRFNGTYHTPGDVIDVTQERYKEICAKGKFVVPVKAKAADKADDAEDSQDSTDDSAEEPEPERLMPAHQYDGLAYIETPVNKVQPQAKEHNER